MKALVLALIVALAAVAPGALNTAVSVAQSTTPIVQLQESDLDRHLHEMYENAWERATIYTELQDGEMPKFPEETVHWLMKEDTWSIDQNMKIGLWHTDIYKTGTARVYAWYKADSGVRVEEGVSLPVNGRIEMLVTIDEIYDRQHSVEGILAHEMIHYIHHMRLMNQKGWATIWPGDGHNYMAYLKFVKGYDLPANRY